MESIPTASGIGPFFRYYIMLLAEARMKFGKFLRHLPSCSRRWQRNEPGVGLFVPELYRFRDFVLRLDSNNESDAIKSLATAVDVAKQQKATFSRELKAAIDLAKAAGASGQQERGLQPLRDVCTNSRRGSTLRSSRKLNGFWPDAD